MLVNAISYFAVVIALLLIAPQPPIISAAQRASMLDSIREGVGYIRREPVLRWVVVLSIATALFTRPYIQLLPAEAQILGVGAVELSFLLAASGVGALTGALATAALGSWQRRGALLVGASFFHGMLLTVFGAQHTLVGAMVFVGLTSFFVMVFLGMANTLMQTRTPDHLRGRAMSVHTMIFMGFMPLGQMLLGSVGAVLGINNAFAAYVAIRVPALRAAIATSRPRTAARSS